MNTSSVTGMSRPRGVVRELLSAMSARLIVLPMAAVAAILTTRMVNEQLGPQPFAVYSLVAGVPLLFAYADLGLGAPITNAAATAKIDPDHFHAIFRRCLLISFCTASAIALASAVLGAAGLWTGLFGLSDPELNLPIALAMIIFGLSIPGGLGRAILLGVGRFGSSVLLQGLTPLISLGIVSSAIGLGANTAGIVAVSSAGVCVVNWIGFIYAAFSMPGTLSDIRRKTQHRVMGEVVRTAMPMFVLMAAGGLLFQSGRLVLSHSSTLQQVAIYSALWTFFQPLLSVVQTAGVALWPRFAAARASGGSLGHEFRSATFTSGLIGLTAGLGLTFLGPFAVQFATAGKIQVTFVQCAILGAALVVEATRMPAAMILTFPRGLWLQSTSTWVSAAIVVILGLLQSQSLGATAPMLALLIAMLIGLATPTVAAAAIFLRRPEITRT